MTKREEDIRDLKVRGYDLIVQLELVQRAIQENNQLLLNKMNEPEPEPEEVEKPS